MVTAAFPRPGRALKTVLIVLAAAALASAIIANWAPGGQSGQQILSWLVFDPRQPARAWTFLTSGLVMVEFSQALWAMLGLYFFAPDLEKSWGGGRLVRFLATSVVLGNLAVFAAHRIVPGDNPLFHPPVVFGPLATVLAVTIAWAKENSHKQIRFMFFLPMSGKTLYWITIGVAALMIVFAQRMAEGAVASFGAILAGVLFGGSPSPVRSLWLRFRLGGLRRKGNMLVIEQERGEGRPRPATKRKPGSPPLRVVPGGLEDDLKNRKPPKDKRYLN